MATRDIHHDKGDIGIVEAVETLSDIADMDMEKEFGPANHHIVNIHESQINYRTVRWIQEQNADGTIKNVKEIFRVVLKFLKDFYQKEYSKIKQEHTIDEIKAIMVLVGEAAKKIDKCTQYFNHDKVQSITTLREYKHLQEFYHTRIANKIDEGILGSWILGLTKLAMKKKTPPPGIEEPHIDTTHVFVDFDTVKRDLEYELFFMRKEDGTRFFSPRLIRNVKLVCDFGGVFGRKKMEDSLSSLGIWLDRFYQRCAKDILTSLGKQVDAFFRYGTKYKNQELSGYVTGALLALLLAANEKNHLKNSPVKSCGEYFKDFQFYLREALNNREYLQSIAFEPGKNQTIAHSLFMTIKAICHALYTSKDILKCFSGEISSIINEAYEKRSSNHKKITHINNLIWDKLAEEYSLMNHLMEGHPNGPLTKVLDLLQEGTYNQFDPLMQGNIPTALFSYYSGQRQISVVRYPSPVIQEYIHKATINEEFKSFLLYKKGGAAQKHLLFDLQDKTSWQEHSRSHAVEHIATTKDFDKHLTVITLPMDTDFYRQSKSYEQDTHASSFMKNFMNNLEDDGTGFYFPKKIREMLFPTAARTLMENVHRKFFKGKEHLTRDNRLDFIELFYFFLQQKIIELLKPDTVCFGCKDGIDDGMIAATQYFILNRLLNNEGLEKNDFDLINCMLYAPAIFFRERLPQQESFYRMLGALKTWELATAGESLVGF